MVYIWSWNRNLNRNRNFSKVGTGTGTGTGTVQKCYRSTTLDTSTYLVFTPGQILNKKNMHQGVSFL